MSRVAHCQICLGLIPADPRSRRVVRYCSPQCRAAAGRSNRTRPTADPSPPDGERARHRYESGSIGLVRHACSGGGMPDGSGRRPALCGAWVRVGPVLFHPDDPAACLRCARSARASPPARQVQPQVDLARVTALLWHWQGDDPGVLIEQLYEIVGRPVRGTRRRRAQEHLPQL